MNVRLVPVVRLDDLELMAPETKWLGILSVDRRRPLVKEGLDQPNRNNKIAHAFVDDVVAYETQLQEIHDGCENDSEWEQRRAELDTGLEAAVQARFAVGTCLIGIERY